MWRPGDLQSFIALNPPAPAGGSRAIPLSDLKPTGRQTIFGLKQDVRKTFQYRLYPTAQQETRLTATLDECRWLYNHLLEQRKHAWEEQQESLGLYDQQATLPALKAARPSLAAVHSQVLQNVAVRIDLAFQAFFRRVKADEQPGYPRFRGPDRYDSFCYPQAPSGCKLNGDRLTLSGIGTVRVVLHRPLEGQPKTVCVHRSPTGKWYVTFA